MSLTLTVTRRGEPTGEDDEQGNPVATPDSTFQIVVRAVAPNPSDETATDAGARVITGYRVFGYKSLAPLLPSDRLTIRGVPGWQVEGEVGLWESAFGSDRGGTEFVVRRSS
jgi:hypothetical protein